jgi:hypothetical protein
MPHYALSIYQPDGTPPPPDVLAPVMRKMNALIEDAKSQRVWVFNGGMHAPSTASVVRLADNEMLVTDGPYVEGKEHIGGFMIVDVPDLDAALHWAKRMAQALVISGHPNSLPVEVRPFSHVGPPG